MPSLYNDDGSLRTLIGFDYETYLLNETLAAPRAVCGSFACLEPLPAWFMALTGDPTRSLYETRDYGGQEVHVALLDADLAATAVLGFLTDAYRRRADADAPLLVAHNAPYDLGATLARLHLMFAAGRPPVNPGPALGLDPRWGVETVAHYMLLCILDLDQMGLPTSPGLLADTMVREILLKNAAGEQLHGYDLGSCVKKYLDEDRSAEKKGPPCSKCAATGKVTEVVAGKAKGVPCVPCGGSGRLVPWRMKYHTLDGVPLNEWPTPAVDYAIEDAIDTIAVAIAQAGPFGVIEHATSSNAVVVDEYGLITDEAHQTRAAWALETARLNGPRSNPETIEVYRAEMEVMAEEGGAIGRRLGFIREDGTRDTKTHQALVEAAYAAMGRSAPRTAPSSRYPDGQIKTDEDTVRLSRDEGLIEYVETNEARLALSKFVPAAERGREGALASSPKVMVSTGRTAWANPAMHQPPRAGMFRECWQARPGRVYVSSDWNAAEMVTLAQILVLMFGKSNMADAINAGQDLHVRLGVPLWNSQHPEDPVDYDELKRRVDAGNRAAKEIRQFSKIANFGFPGGLAARTFVDYARGYGVIISEATAEEIRNAWLAAWPEMHDYLEAFKELASGDYFTYEQWVTGRIRGQVGYTNGCNTGFQGLVSDALKIVLWWLVWETFIPVTGSKKITVSYPHSSGDPMIPREISITVPDHRPGEGSLYGSRVWLSLHDEVLMEAPEASASNAAKRLGTLMVWALRYCTPDVAVGAAPALMRRWYKGAEPVYSDLDGVLVPWEPAAEK